VSHSAEFTQFLIDVAVEVPRVFGRDVRYSLVSFDYPDEPDASELHLVIDTDDMEPERACELLDELCDSWWDVAAARLDVEIFPVLGTVVADSPPR
jgi:hypothetical protein